MPPVNPIRISSPSGKTPIPTSPSTSKPKRSTPSCSSVEESRCSWQPTFLKRTSGTADGLSFQPLLPLASGHGSTRPCFPELLEIMQGDFGDQLDPC